MQRAIAHGLGAHSTVCVEHVEYLFAATVALDLYICHVATVVLPASVQCTDMGSGGEVAARTEQKSSPFSAAANLGASLNPPKVACCRASESGSRVP